MKTNVKTESEPATELRSIEIDLIVPSRTNPRKSFPPETMQELTESIKQHGVQQPLIVRPLSKAVLMPPDLVDKRWHLKVSEPNGLPRHFYFDVESKARLALNEYNGGGGEEFEIVAGERRWRAAKAAGMKCVPCLVRALGDRAARQAQALENLQRVDLNPIEEAEGYRLLMTEDKLTVADLQAKLGRSRSHIFAKLALLKLCPAVKKAMETGKVSASVGELIGRFEGEKEQERALKLIQEEEEEMFADADETEPLSFRKAAELLKENFMAELNKAPFDVEATYAGAPHAEPCGACPHRSANCRETYPEIASPNVCTQPACYRQKAKLEVERKLAPYRAQGLEVLDGKKAHRLFQYGSFHGSEDFSLGAAPCYDDPKQRTMEKILGNAMPEPVVALDDKGNVRKLYKRAELQTALAAAGIKPTKDNREGLITQAERKRTQEAEGEAAKRLLPLMHAELKLKKNERAAWRSAVRIVQDGNCAALEPALALEGFKKQSLERVMDKMEPEQVLRILALGTLFDYAGEPDWDYMQALAKELGLDTKRLLKEVEAELKPGNVKKEIRQSGYMVNTHDVISNPQRIELPMPAKCKAVVTIGLGAGAWFLGYDRAEEVTSHRASGSALPSVKGKGYPTATAAIAAGIASAKQWAAGVPALTALPMLEKFDREFVEIYGLQDEQKATKETKGEIGAPPQQRPTIKGKGKGK